MRGGCTLPRGHMCGWSQLRREPAQPARWTGACRRATRRRPLDGKDVSKGTRTKGRLCAGITTALAVAVMACASLPGSGTAPPSAPMIVDVAAPATPSDAGHAPPVCKTAFMHGSFCDELGELWRVVESEGAMRRCISGSTEHATSALPGIVMYCQAKGHLDPDCAGNPPPQSDVVAKCRLFIHYQYGDKNHDLTPYVERAAAAVAACDPTYRASPIRDVGARDKAIVFSHPPEQGWSLQKVVSVCSQLGDLPADELLDQPEIVPAHYDVVVELYGVARGAGAPLPH